MKKVKKLQLSLTQLSSLLEANLMEDGQGSMHKNDQSKSS